MEDDTSSFFDHKLCDFLYAVLTVTFSPDHRQIPPFGTCFSISQCDVNFTSQNGVVLTPIDPVPSADVSAEELKQCEVPVRELGRKRKVPVVAKRKIGMRRSMRSIGLVHESINVVHQLHALVVNKCLRIDARLVQVEAEDSGEVRAVVLVDVYLPIAMLAGWQFPRSGSVAGALFRHLSSDWGERRAMLINGYYLESTLRADRNIWNLYDCHVFGCKLHHDFTDSSFSSRRHFQLRSSQSESEALIFPRSIHFLFVSLGNILGWCNILSSGSVCRLL